MSLRLRLRHHKRGDLPVRARRQANRNRVRRAFAGPVPPQAGLSPLSIISSVRILGAYVLKDVCLPREVFHVPRDAACGRKWLRAGQPAPTAWKKSAACQGIARRAKPEGHISHAFGVMKARTVAG